MSEQVNTIESYVLVWLESFEENTIEQGEQSFLDSGGDPSILQSDTYNSMEEKIEYLLPQIASQVRDDSRPKTHLNTELYLYEYLLSTDDTFSKLVEELISHRRDYKEQVDQIHSVAYFNSQRSSATVQYEDDSNFQNYVTRMNELYALQGTKVEFVPYNDLAERLPCDGPQ